MTVVVKEVRATLALALPIIVSQVSQMLIGVTDSIMIGRLGAVPLAASAFVGGLFAVFFVVGLGLLLPVAVLVSREHGAGDERAGRRWVQHGVILAVIASVLEMALMLVLTGWFHGMGQPAEVLGAVHPYYGLITASLLPTLVFQVFRQSAEAEGRPWGPMLIMLAGVVLNVVLNWILIYGHLGVPALGLAGAGWATLISRVAVLGAIVAWLHGLSPFRVLRPAAWPRNGGGVRAPAGRTVSRVGNGAAHDEDGRGFQAWRFREMLRIGVPASVMLFFEVGAFMMAALMMGWLGATALAAHQIALSCAGFMFMFPLGLSMAVGIRVSKAVGEGRTELLRPIVSGALGLSCAIMSVSAVGFAVFGSWLARGFVGDPVVVDLASRLLVVAAIFQLFDGAQVIGSGALRGLTDVRIPAAITFIAYWIVAIPGGYVLGLHTRFGAVGIWAGLAAGLALAALLLALRFIRLTK